MGVSDIQYSLILLNALPESYEVVATTLLASSPASDLKYSKITTRVLNEEGRKLGPSASLNVARTGKKTSLVTCNYCHKKGHVSHDCRKKKKDEAEKAEEEDSSTLDSSDSKSESEKEANALVYVPATADKQLNVVL